VRHQIQLFKIAATGRWAIGLPSASTLAPFALMYAMERESGFARASFGASFQISLCGLLISYLYLFLIQATILRTRKEELQKLSHCIFAWVSTGVVSGLISDMYAQIVLGRSSHMLIRVFNSSVFSTFAFALAAFYFGTIARNRVENSALASLDHLLEVDSAGLNAEQHVAYQEAVLRFEIALTPRVQQLQDLTRTLDQYATSNDRRAAIENLQTQAEELRLKLNLEFEALEIINRKNKTNSRPAKNTPQVGFFGNLFPPVLSVRTACAILFFGGITGQITRNGLSGALVSVMSCALLTGFLLAYRSLFLRINKLSRKLIYPWPYLFVFAIQYFYTSHVTTFGIHLHRPYEPWYSAIKSVMGIYLASILSFLATENSISSSKFSSDRAEREIEIQKLNISSENLSRFNTSTNFGKLQGKISGVIFALNMLKDGSNMRGDKVDFDRYLQDTNELLSESIWEIRNLAVKESLD